MSVPSWSVTWTVIVAEKGLVAVARRLERVQGVLVQDRRDATYKLALIRALLLPQVPNAVVPGQATHPHHG